MARLTRAERQERTRTAVLEAARDEFAERGFADAKVDRIAERAELTRGAVYSNFPSKRALYLAVLLDLGERPDPAAVSAPSGLAEALEVFARMWLDRLPLSGESPGDGRLRLGSWAGVFDDEPGRTALAQVTRLEALLLALALEARAPDRGRAVRLAELVLTLLRGADQLAREAPGFGDPFDLARACQHLAGLDLADTWDPPHLPYVPPARAVQQVWEPPGGLRDEITGEPVELHRDGVVAVLGTGRLAAAEEAVRAARQGEQVTVAVATSDPAEVGRLIRLRIRDLVACVRGAFAVAGLPAVRLVLAGDIGAAFGIERVDDDTEVAVRVEAGTIVARADGRGAAHAVGSWQVFKSGQPPR